MSRVFVLGNASIDTTLRVPRLPLPGETLMAEGLLRAPGGKGLNQAVAAARAGAEVHFCAPLGTEPEADPIRAALAAESLAECRLVDVGLSSDLSTLLVAPSGENCIISTGACSAALKLGAVQDFLAPMRQDDILLVQGNLSAEVTRWAVEHAGRAIVNTAPIRWSMAPVLRSAWIVIANRVEAAELCGDCDAGLAASRLGGAIGIVTCGAAGSFLHATGSTRHHPAPEVAAIDTTGAGDVFCGVLTAMLAGGQDVAPALDTAQRAASLSVTRLGCFTAIPSRTELASLAH